MMVDIFNKIQESKSYILNKVRSTPSVGIILGTGLGDLINEIKIFGVRLRGRYYW